MINEAIVLAGGMGTRLRSIIEDIPKPMASVAGKPFLEYQLRYLQNQGIQRVILSVGYKADYIQSVLGNKFEQLELVYCVENEPLGTGGGLQKAFELVQGNAAFVVNGDTLFDIPLFDLYQFHLQKKSQFSLALRQLNEVSRFGCVVIDVENSIISFAEKGLYSGEGFINGGTYIIDKEFFTNNHFAEKFSLETEVFEKMHRSFSFYAKPFKSYFLDIGIPDDYQKAQYEIPQLGY